MSDVDMIYALTSVDVLYRKLSWVATWRNVAEDNVFLFTFAQGNGKIRPDWKNMSIGEFGLKLINRSYADLVSKLRYRNFRSVRAKVYLYAIGAKFVEGNDLWPNDLMHLVFFLQIGVYFFKVQNDLFLGPREALRLVDQIYQFKQVGAQKELAAIAYDSETDDDDDAENVTPLLNGKKSCVPFHKNNFETASPNSKPTSNYEKSSLPALSSGYDSKEDLEELVTADIDHSKKIKNLETRSKTADIGKSKSAENLETRPKTADIGKSKSVENLKTSYKTADVGKSESIENLETRSLPDGLLKARHDAEFAPIKCAKSLSLALGQYVPDSSNLLATKLPTSPGVDSPTQEESLKQKAQTSACQDDIAVGLKTPDNSAPTNLLTDDSEEKPLINKVNLKSKSQKDYVLVDASMIKSDNKSSDLITPGAVVQPDTHEESLRPELSPLALKDGAADSSEPSNRSELKCLPTDIQPTKPEAGSPANKCPPQPKRSTAHQDVVLRAKTIPCNPLYERLIIKSSRDSLDVSSDIVYALGCKSVIKKALREVKKWRNVPLDDTFLYSYAFAYFEMRDGVVPIVGDFSNLALDLEASEWPFAKLVGKLRHLRVCSRSAWAIIYVIGYKLYCRGENWPLDLMNFNFFRWLALRYQIYLRSPGECKNLNKKYENTDLLPSYIRMFRLVPKDTFLQVQVQILPSAQFARPVITFWRTPQPNFKVL